MSDRIRSDKYELLVSGYMRRMEKTLKIDVPVDVISVVYILYPKLDKWNKDLSNEKLVIDNDDYMIKRECGTKLGWFNGYVTDQVKPKEFV